MFVFVFVFVFDLLSSHLVLPHIASGFSTHLFQVAQVVPEDGIKNLRILGFKDLRILGFKDIRILGFTYSRI